MPCNDIDNDGSTHDWGDGIEGNDGGGREGAKEIAEEGKDGTGEHGDRQEHPMVGGAEQEEGDVGCGESEESDRTAIGGDDGGQESCGEEQKMAGALDVDAEVGGV